MKRIVKIILIILFSFVFVNNVKADPATETENFCREKLKKATGCYYDPSDTSKDYSEYTKIVTKGGDVTMSYADTIISGVNDNTSAVFDPDSFYNGLTRGYIAFDKNDNAVYAGCWKYNYDGKTDGTRDRLFSDGVIYIFKILTPEKKCKGENSFNNTDGSRLFLAPSKDIKRYAAGNIYDSKTGKFNLVEDHVYTGQECHNPQITFSRFKGWTAKADGDCPKFFAINPDAKNEVDKYIFTDDGSKYVKFSYGTLISGASEHTATVGCTAEDIPGREENKQLVEEVINNEILGKDCPDKLEDMEEFHQNFEDIYENLRKGNGTRTNWSADLIEYVTNAEGHDKITNAITKKIHQCSYQLCGLTSSEQTRVENEIAKDNNCKNGCSLHRIINQSDSSNSKCYCCTSSSSDCTYQWFEGGGNCALQEHIPHGQCIGTNSDLNCRECLMSAYTRANLSEEKKSCIAGNEITLELTLQKIKLASKAAADASAEKEKEEAAEVRAKMNRGIVNAEMFFYDKYMSCEEVLGSILTKILKTGITIIQIVCAIIAIVKGMMIIIPAVIAKDADALKKGSKTLTAMGIVLVSVLLFRPFVRLLGNILGFDISCIL